MGLALAKLWKTFGCLLNSKTVLFVSFLVVGLINFIDSRFFMPVNRTQLSNLMLFLTEYVMGIWGMYSVDVLIV